jgi:hypothetical protein
MATTSMRRTVIVGLLRVVMVASFGDLAPRRFRHGLTPVSANPAADQAFGLSSRSSSLGIMRVVIV